METFTEVPFTLGDRTIRPDGLIRVSHGKSTWTCLVEVKTGTAKITPEQVNVVSVRCQGAGLQPCAHRLERVSQQAGTHPTPGLRVRASSPVQVSHLSWASILTTCIRIINHEGVDDPEQAWILGELIRYMEHRGSGVLSFDDMGGSWPTIRDAARASTLTKNTAGIEDVASRFERVRYAALTLSAQVGLSVEPVIGAAS